MSRREKKQLLPLILLTILFWAMLVLIIVKVDPLVLKNFPIQDSYGLFLGIVFMAWFFLLALIFNNTRRGFIYALGIALLLGLRLIRLGNIVNGVLLFGLLVVIDFYLANR